MVAPARARAHRRAQRPDARRRDARLRRVGGLRRPAACEPPAIACASSRCRSRCSASARAPRLEVGRPSRPGHDAELLAVGARPGGARARGPRLPRARLRRRARADRDRRARRVHVPREGAARAGGGRPRAGRGRPRQRERRRAGSLIRPGIRIPAVAAGAAGAGAAWAGADRSSTPWPRRGARAT